MRVKILYAKPKAKFVPISWLIKLAEFGRLSDRDGSHVAIEFCGKTTSAVFDSIAPRSRITAKTRWDEHYQTLKAWEFDVSLRNTPSSIDWILQNTDKPYSRLQCVIIGIGELFGGWVQKLAKKQNPNGSDYLICVEAGARFASEFLGVKFSSGFDVIGLEEFVDTLDKYSES